ISPHRLDDIGLTPEGGQFKPMPDTFLITVKDNFINADYYDKSGLFVNRIRIRLSTSTVVPYRANWRGPTFRNVRQQLGFRLDQNSFTLFADTGYNGKMVNMGTFPLGFNLPWWGSDVHFLWSNGAYHVAKTADRPNGPINRVGLINGKPYLTNPRMLTHWGMIGIRAPKVKPFPTPPIVLGDGFYQMPPMNNLMKLATPFVG